MKSALQLILAEFDIILNDETSRVLLHKPIPTGLGGQVSGRVRAMMIALLLGRRPLFPINDDPPYSQSFLPFYERDKDIQLEGAETANLDLNQTEQVIVYDALNAPVTNTQLEKLIKEKCGKLKIENIERELLEGALFSRLQLTDEMKRFVDSEIDRLSVDHNCLGVHFRRGDKSVETAFVPSSKINSEISNLYENWKFKKLFLASDDPDACNQIVAPDGVPIVFDKLEIRYNNANHKMLLSHPERVDQETRAAIKNIYLLGTCGGVIGQTNAHFATLAAIQILYRENRHDRIILIDGKYRERNSKVVSFYFMIKRALRVGARHIFPFMQTTRRMKKWPR